MGAFVKGPIGQFQPLFPGASPGLAAPEVVYPLPCPGQLDDQSAARFFAIFHASHHT
jgi:hypothetical protein